MGNSLVDGNYELLILAEEIRSAGTDTTMAFDQAFGHEAADGFFRLWGDSDGDRDVDGQDFGRFGLSFQRSSGDPEYDSDFDFDGDGDVDGQDYGRLVQRMRTRLPPLTAVA